MVHNSRRVPLCIISVPLSIFLQSRHWLLSLLLVLIFWVLKKSLVVFWTFSIVAILLIARIVLIVVGFVV